jgi:penicillin amidase
MDIAKVLFRFVLGRRMPIIEGTLSVLGIQDALIIRRDGYGIPYIEATNEADAWYGLGFCHGQDRAFQIEGLLRVIHGRLAEIVGPKALPIDRLARRIGFALSAKEQYDRLDQVSQQMIQAYARGVNEGIAFGCDRVAHEFSLLGTKPTPYQPEDVLGMVKFMSFNLASNWDVELTRYKIILEDGPEALAALDHTYPEWQPVSAAPTRIAGPAIDHLAHDVAIFKATFGPGGASNNWAIRAERTATGRPILANDPHLPPALPAYWYLAHVRTPEWAVAGASFAGTLGFLSGHNGTAAWGMTAAMLDNTDLFIEEIGPDRESVRQGERFITCPAREEIIKVKGRKPVVERVMITPRGPIVGPAFEGEFGALSLSATWLKPLPIKGLLQIHRARTFEEFQAAFADWPILPLNMAYADTSNTIAWQMVGTAPRRRRGWGILPLPGWDTQNGWEEDGVPFAEMPFLKNPADGYLATANTQPLPSGEGPFLGVDWLDGYRLNRILQSLGGRNDWDIASTARLQTDQTSLPWQEIKDKMLSLPRQHPLVRQALDILEIWDGIVAVDCVAATIYELFMAEMIRRTVKAKAPKTWRWVISQGYTPLIPSTMNALRCMGQLVKLLCEEPDGWFERSWPEEISDALATVVAYLKKRYGANELHWSWGHIRTLTLKNPVGERPPLDQIFNLGPFPWGGDANTVGQSSVDPLNPLGNPLFIASHRMVIDVGNWDECQFILPGGQSGNPTSPHYDDLLPLWQKGTGVPIAWSPEKIEAGTKAVLKLELSLP